MKRWWCNLDQVKSKQRVSEHGEVFTSKKDVEAMLNLVKDETERIDSRFLEPACGTGNFLIEIEERKLDLIFEQYCKSQTECEKYLIIGIGSIYGIDLLNDNIQECRQRLFSLFKNRYRAHCKKYATDEFEEIIEFIISKNIVCGDALTMLDLDGKPIVFSEWSIVTGCNIKRRDYSFSELIKTSGKQTSLFDAGWTSEKKKAEFIPNPVKEYSSKHYLRLKENE